MGWEDKYKEMIEKSIDGESLRWVGRGDVGGFKGWKSRETGRTVTLYWVGVGEITCPDLAKAWGKKLCDPEYQFSNGPAGYRATSWDYPSLQAGMADLCKDGAVIIWEDDNNTNGGE